MPAMAGNNDVPRCAGALSFHFCRAGLALETSLKLVRAAECRQALGTKEHAFRAARLTEFMNAGRMSRVFTAYGVQKMGSSQTQTAKAITVKGAPTLK